ncbi:hypothetical protein [Endozoicomonas sp. NE40]|uniref:Uncharacterized protein n=1 Tax=Endozoicomonas lisbonensis TaxID=3120522 RepID=A0ABV2SER9_9GAMM
MKQQFLHQQMHLISFRWVLETVAHPLQLKGNYIEKYQESYPEASRCPDQTKM